MVVRSQRQRKNSLIITQITDNEYLIEGEIDLVKIGCIVDPIISYIDISNGPFLQIGRDFFGKGTIKNIDLIEQENFPILKIGIITYETTQKY